MAYDDDEDFFGEDFDFVDDDDDGSEGSTDQAEESSSESVEDSEGDVSEPKEKRQTGRSSRRKKIASDSDSDNADADDGNGSGSDEKVEEKEPEPEGPPADHVVHVYEFGDFKRTIQREFTAEDAEAFVTEYNRTGKHYNRTALVAAKDGEPAPAL